MKMGYTGFFYFPHLCPGFGSLMCLCALVWHCPAAASLNERRASQSDCQEVRPVVRATLQLVWQGLFLLMHLFLEDYIVAKISFSLY